MASIVKIKRSSVQGKKPTTSEITGGELALNTRDGKLFSSDGTTTFEVGANLHSLSVGTGGLTFANGSISLPTSDGSSDQVLMTDGSGSTRFGSVSVDYIDSDSTGYTISTKYASALTTESDFGDLTTSQVDAFGVTLISIHDLMEPLGRIESVDLGTLT
jgi:hypothetical protein